MESKRVFGYSATTTKPRAQGGSLLLNPRLSIIPGSISASRGSRTKQSLWCVLIPDLPLSSMHSCGGFEKLLKGLRAAYQNDGSIQQGLGGSKSPLE